MTLTMSYITAAATLVLAVLTFSHQARAVEIRAVPFTMGPLPNLTDALAPNERLKNAQKFKVDQIVGAESFAFHKGHIYTGLGDGRIIDISDCGIKTVARLAPQGCTGPLQCGRPQGMRIDSLGRLVVADAYRGIFRVNLQTGSKEVLYSPSTRVGSRPSRFINDLAISSDGTILFTDSSSRWTKEESLWLLLEGNTDGRLLAYSDKSNQAIVVLKNLAFPNGLELGPNDEYLLIAETGRARIKKLNLSGGKDWLKVTDFATNLPGLPDNIRKSGRGSYWVAMMNARHSNMSSMLDDYDEQAQMRAIAARVYSKSQIEALTTKYGMVVELDVDGNIISSLQDPTGETMPSVTEANERDGYLYLGSENNKFVSRIPTTTNFHVERLLTNLKSTCRATNINLGRLRTVLRRLVAIAELRRTLLAARKREDEQNARQATTSPSPDTSTDATSVDLNSTASSTSTTSQPLDVNLTSSMTTDTPETSTQPQSTLSGVENTSPSIVTSTAAATTTRNPEDGDGGIVARTTAAATTQAATTQAATTPAATTPAANTQASTSAASAGSTTVVTTPSS